MKKILMITVLIAALCGIAYAETPTDDAEYQDMDKLRRKIVRMKKEMDLLIKDIVSTYPSRGSSALVGDFGQDVRVDIVEDDKKMLVKADLPGMDKDKIEITLEKGKYLKIAGTREMMNSQTAPGVVRQERAYGRFERVVELPSEGMNSGISANYKSGVLEIAIPKKKIAPDEKVKIEVM